MAQAKVVSSGKVRYAVVAVGWISQTAFLPAVEHTGNSEVVALVTGHLEKAQKVGEKYGIHTVFTYDEFPTLLASGAIDAVYIATPNFDHVELSVQALEAGIHLLLEKPMGISVAECERINAAAQGSGAKLMIAYRLHHEPGMLAAIEIARSGKLGKLRYFNSSFSQVVHGQNHRAKHGFWAGPVPDMGPYPINTVRNLFGEEPTEVFATGAITDPSRFTMHDTVAVTLKFDSHRLATMALSYNAQDLDDFRVVGDLGDLFSQPAFGIGSQMKHVLTIGEEKTEKSYPKTDHFGGEIKYFSNCILNNLEPEANGEEGLLDVRIFAAIEQALLTGQPQTLAPVTRRRRPSLQQVEKLPAVEEPVLVDVHRPSDGQ